MRKTFTMIMTAAILITSLAGCRVNVSADPSKAAEPKEEMTEDKTEKSEESPEKKTSLEEKVFPVYIGSMDMSDNISLYFINGGPVPYMEINDIAETVRNVTYYFVGSNTGDGKRYELSVETDGDKAKLTREDGYYMTIDFENDTFDFLDYNAFLRAGEETILDPAANSGVKDKDGVEYFVRRGDETNTMFGRELIMEPGRYGIDLVRIDDKYFIPLQTVSDILFAARNINTLFNGENVYIVAGGYLGSTKSGLTPLGESYYSAEATNMVDKELAKFSYNEFCFAFDQLYGLKQIHGIESFDSLASNSGYKEILTGTDAVAMDKAYYEIICRYLDDKHSKYGTPSYLAGKDAAKDFGKDIGEGIARNEMNALRAELSDVRSKYYPDGVPGYEEIGNTAYITFDSYEDATMDYYKESPTEDAPDTIGLISYSVGRILRDDSPVKNVVLDMSQNVGGVSITAAYTLAALIGKAQISVENTATGARETSVFYADTNLDHKFDESDTLEGRGMKLFCLTSPASFSCGNLVPCYLKNSGKATIIGKQSGGGSCSSMFLSTATGSFLRISSYNRLSFLKNGAFYDIDQGAPVDFAIVDYDHYYDRKALTEYINGLY